MPTYLHPGVYVEEISGGARPIEAVGTSTAAFVGIAEKGPIDEARFVTNFTEFMQIYGGYDSDNTIGKSYLAYSVFQFFQNGGTACYVVRVEDGAETAELKLYTNEGTHTMTVKAVSPGKWGNGLRIAIGDGTTSDTGFNMYVFIGDELVESYEDLSMVNSSTFFVDRVTKRSQYVRTESVDLPDSPTLTGKQDLSSGVSLQNVKKIKVQIDNFGPYTIDCSKDATDVTAVTANEIRDNINEVFIEDAKIPVASVSNDRVVITSSTADDDSKIILTAPGNQDATYDIFGLQESSWNIKGSKATIAQVLGRSAPDTTAARNLSIAFGNGATQPVIIALGADLFTVVSTINAALGNDVAYTDGTNVILSTDQDITIKRTDIVPANAAALVAGVNEIFGAGFYSYVHIGSGGDTASIVGNVDVVLPVTGQLRLKIDKTSSFMVNFNNVNTVDAVADAINSAYQKASKNKKKIAQTNVNRITLNSINTDANGRIIVSSHTGTDSAGAVLGTAHVNSSDYLIPAEEQSVARLDGTTNFLGGTLGAGLNARLLRMSADGDPVQFNAGASADTLSTFISSVPAGLNYKLLARVTAASQTVHIIAASLSGVPELRFSIPLTGGAATAHIADVLAATQTAYRRLFGNIVPFAGDPVTLPKYKYSFGLPDNKPDGTLIVSGEEVDFSQSLSLLGGDQNRVNENKIRDLTVGTNGKSGLRLLDILIDISILVIPGWSKMSDPVAKTFIDSGTSYCDKVRPAQARPLRDLFLVTNTPASVTKPEDARDYAKDKIGYRSSGGYAALYYPWVLVNDPIGTDSPTIPIPPAGMIAGLYASIDGRRGVWKAPAGTGAGLANIVKLADQVNDIKQDLLNPHGVNAIRRMPGAGIVSWGARTLYTNPEWKYVPIRRTAIMMEVSIYEGIQWAVFEPNDEPLWSLLRLNINAFMMNLFKNGAFQGAIPDEAFFVQCNAETTTQVDIDLGKVNILVGFAPLKPAEFVIVKISQKAGKTE